MGVLPQAVYPLFLAFLFVAAPLRETSATTVLWTAPAILLSALMIAWAAESAQYFVAQGFALAMLAWMQTLPEFAVEAVLAWHQQTHLLLANLTGALRLLTGLGWPAIYFTAAFSHRRATGNRSRRIVLEEHHSVEVMGLMLPAALYPRNRDQRLAHGVRRRGPDRHLRRVPVDSWQASLRRSRNHRRPGDHPAHHREGPPPHCASSPSERCSSPEAR